MLVEEKLRLHLATIAAFVLLASLPFADQAFQMDDTVYVYAAEQILKTPLDPYGNRTINWANDEIPLSTIITHPPLVPYMIALSAALSGGMTEVASHVFFAAFYLLAAFSVYFMARRFTNYPLHATLLFAATPAIMIMSHTVMADVPLLALSLASLCAFTARVPSTKMLAASAVFAGLASLAAYQALALLPVMAAYCAVYKKSFRNLIIVSATQAAFLAAWSVQNVLLYGKPSLLQSASYIGFSIVGNASRILSASSNIGGASVFSLTLIYVFWKHGNAKMRSAAGLLAAALLLAALSFRYPFAYTLPQIALLAAFSFGGMLAILSVAGAGLGAVRRIVLRMNLPKHELNMMFLSVWFGVVLVYSIFFVYYGAVRYALFIVPPLVMIFTNKAAMITKNTRLFLVAALVLTALAGFFASYADYAYANVYRDFATQKESYDGRVWFTGHWGFQYYAEKAGFTALKTGFYPAAGDWVIEPRFNYHQNIEYLKGVLVLNYSVSYFDPVPVRTMNPKSHAGFYSQGSGFLPISVSRAELETFNVYKVCCAT